MDTTQFLGAHGGQLALAFGSGCVAGYGFCMRTIYRLLEKHTEKQLTACTDRIEVLENDKKELHARMQMVEDRLYTGQERQLAQIKLSSGRVMPRMLDSREYVEDKE